MATFYIHWPFFFFNFSYCNFNSYVAHADQDEWLKKYKMLITKFPSAEITSVYFGGGTPSLLSPSFIQEILDTINPINNAEITIEINPNTVNYEKLLQFKHAGINRVSIGVQSIYDDQLKLLGRTSHTVSDAVLCIKNCSKVFDNVSIDLIYNRPFQTHKQWETELTRAVERFSDNIKHISCYELILEQGTPLTKSVKQGILPAPINCDKFFDITRDVLHKFGFELYEISNFSQNGFQSQHNLSYWKYDDYYGIGPGAHSRITQNGKKIAIEQSNSINNFTFKETVLTDTDVLEERLIMGLRTVYGVPSTLIPTEKINALKDEKYAMCDGSTFVLTFEGMKRLNSVITYIISS